MSIYVCIFKPPTQRRQPGVFSFCLGRAGKKEMYLAFVLEGLGKKVTFSFCSGRAGKKLHLASVLEGLKKEKGYI